MLVVYCHLRIAILSANYGGSVVRQECEYGMLYTVAALSY